MPRRVLAGRCWIAQEVDCGTLSPLGQASAEALHRSYDEEQWAEVAEVLGTPTHDYEVSR